MSLTMYILIYKIFFVHTVMLLQTTKMGLQKIRLIQMHFIRNYLRIIRKALGFSHSRREADVLWKMVL